MTALETECNQRGNTIKDLEFYVLSLKKEIDSLKSENSKLLNTFTEVELHVESNQTEMINLRSKYEQIIKDLQDKNSSLERFKNSHGQNEQELHSVEQKLDDAKINQIKLEDKLRDKEREILYLTDKLHNQPLMFNSQEGYDSYHDAKYNLKSTLKQKQDEITQLMAENKTLKLKLSSRPES